MSILCTFSFSYVINLRVKTNSLHNTFSTHWVWYCTILAYFTLSWKRNYTSYTLVWSTNCISFLSSCKWETPIACGSIKWNDFSHTSTDDAWIFGDWLTVSSCWTWNGSSWTVFTSTTLINSLVTQCAFIWITYLVSHLSSLEWVTLNAACSILCKDFSVSTCYSWLDTVLTSFIWSLSINAVNTRSCPWDNLVS